VEEIPFNHLARFAVGCSVRAGFDGYPFESRGNA
jgi:hypothetical protein